MCYGFPSWHLVMSLNIYLRFVISFFLLFSSPFIYLGSVFPIVKMNRNTLKKHSKSLCYKQPAPQVKPQILYSCKALEEMCLIQMQCEKAQEDTTLHKIPKSVLPIKLCCSLHVYTLKSLRLNKITKRVTVKESKD